MDVAGSLISTATLSNTGAVSFFKRSQRLNLLSGTGSLTLNSTALTVVGGNYSGAISGSGSLIKDGAVDLDGCAGVGDLDGSPAGDDSPSSTLTIRNGSAGDRQPEGSATASK